MALNIDAKFEGKLTCTFQNDMKNQANFYSQAEKQQFKIKMAELNKNKNQSKSFVLPWK